jgi:hypothetical protein
MPEGPKAEAPPPMMPPGMMHPGMMHPHGGPPMGMMGMGPSIRLRYGDLALSVHCGVRDDASACADTALRVIDRLLQASPEQGDRGSAEHERFRDGGGDRGNSDNGDNGDYNGGDGSNDNGGGGDSSDQ